MRGKDAKRYACFLIVILCIKDISEAKQLSSPLRVLVKTRDKESDYEENGSNITTNEEIEDNEERSRPKRGIGRLIRKLVRRVRKVRKVRKVIKKNGRVAKKAETVKSKKAIKLQKIGRNIKLGIATFATLTSVLDLSIEMTVFIKGCCGIIDEICQNSKKIEKTKSNIIGTGKHIDKNLKDAEMVSRHLNGIKPRLVDLGQQIGRITHSLVRIITNTIISSRKDNAKEVHKGKNETLQKWNKNKSTKDEDRALNIVLLSIGIGITVYETGSFINELREVYKGEYKSQTKTGNIAAKDSDYQKGHIKKKIKDKIKKIVGYDTIQSKKARKGLLSTMDITFSGLGMYMMIHQIKNCYVLKKKLRKTKPSIKMDENKLKVLMKNVTGYHEYLDNVYNTDVREQLTQQSVFDVLSAAKRVAEKTSSQPHLQAAIKVIDIFKREIKRANKSQTFFLVDKLTNALVNVEYTIRCVEDKANALSVIRSNCKKGNDDLKAIYDSVMLDYGTNKGNCTTNEKIKYTTFRDIQKSIRYYAGKEKFNFDCKLNNRDLLRSVCSDKCSGFTNITITTRNKVGINKLYYLLERCSGPCAMPKTVVDEVCYLRNAYNIPFKGIYKGKKASYTKEQVQVAYDSCSSPDEE